MADEAGGQGTKGGSKTPSGNLAWLWMLLALAAVGGFLTWLGVASEPTSVAVVEDSDRVGQAEDDPSVTVVPKDTLGANKARYIGQRIRVHNVEATGTLGPTIFWGELGDRSNQIPILIRMDSATAAGSELQVGGLYSVTGSVSPMTDSLATAWAEAGELAGEGERLQASFADMYFMTDQIRPTPASMREESGSGSGTSSDTASAGGQGG